MSHAFFKRSEVDDAMSVCSAGTAKSGMTAKSARSLARSALSEAADRKTLVGALRAIAKEQRKVQHSLNREEMGTVLQHRLTRAGFAPGKEVAEETFTQTVNGIIETIEAEGPWDKLSTTKKADLNFYSRIKAYLDETPAPAFATYITHPGNVFQLKTKRTMISDDIQKVAFGVGGKAGMVLNEINHKVFQRKVDKLNSDYKEVFKAMKKIQAANQLLTPIQAREWRTLFCPSVNQTVFNYIDMRCLYFELNTAFECAKGVAARERKKRSASTSDVCAKRLKYNEDGEAVAMPAETRTLNIRRW